MNTQTPTAETFIAKYAADIAFAADEPPATTLHDFAAQVATAADNFDDAGIDGHEDLNTAADHLYGAASSTASDTDRTTLLGWANELLGGVDAAGGFTDYRNAA